MSGKIEELMSQTEINVLHFVIQEPVACQGQTWFVITSFKM